MMTNWSMLDASIEHLTRNDTQFSEMVFDSRERTSTTKDKTKEHVMFEARSSKATTMLKICRRFSRFDLSRENILAASCTALCQL